MQRSITLKLVALAAVILVAPLRAQSEDAQDPLFAPLGVPQIDDFIDAIRSNVRLNTPPQHVTQAVDGDIAGIWAGSKSKVESLFGDLTLRFRPKTEALLSSGSPGEPAGSKFLDWFDLKVSVQEGRMFIEHSAVAGRRDAARLVTRFDREKDPTRLAFIPGQKGSGVYIAVPIAKSPATNWGIFVCPREASGLEKGGSGTGFELSPSSYELSEASFSAQASADGTMATSGPKGRIKVVMNVSKGLPQPKVPVDEAVSILPNARVLYVPDTAFDFYRVAPFSDVQQGIVSMIEMQNRAGYIRRQFFSHQRLIHKSDEPTPVKLVVNRRQLTNDRGECYIVIEQSYSWMEYDKQPASFQ